MHNSESRTILFFIRSAGYLKTYRSMILALLARGFAVVAAFDPSPRELDASSVQVLDAFAHDNQGFIWVHGVRRGGVWKRILRPVREMLNYRRFIRLQSRAPFYEELCFRFMPRTIQKILRTFPFLEKVLASRLVDWLLRFVEWCAPPVPKMLEQMRAYRPAAVLVAFRNRPSSSPDLDYLKAARYLGIQTIVPTPSWDNLSSKGLLQILPDLLLVWNEEQVREAVRHHKVPRERIRIVGAYQFDGWRALRAPRESRDAFCSRIGVPTERKYILYLGSGAVTGDSTKVVDELRLGMDASQDPDVSNAYLVVRPAPNNFVAFSSYKRERVVVCPHKPVPIGTPEGVELLLATITYAEAAVTIHTTGIIDAMLKGKPGFVMLRQEYKALQDAEHFAHLVRSGAATVFRTGDEFASEVGSLLSGHDKTKAAREVFLRDYILPPTNGDVSAGELAAQEIEQTIALKMKQL